MWVDLGIGFWHTLVGKDVVDRAEGEHDEPEGRFRGVEAVGAVDDEPDAPIEAFVLGIVDTEADRGEDPLFALANGLRDGDEGLEAAPLRLRAEPVEELAYVVLVQVPGEDGTKGLLERIATP